MIRLDIYPMGETTIWWRNFCEYHRPYRRKLLYELLREWGCHLAPGNVLVFDNERDSIVFLLRWS